MLTHRLLKAGLGYIGMGKTNLFSRSNLLKEEGNCKQRSAMVEAVSLALILSFNSTMESIH